MKFLFLLCFFMLVGCERKAPPRDLSVLQKKDPGEILEVLRFYAEKRASSFELPIVEEVSLEEGARTLLRIGAAQIESDSMLLLSSLYRNHVWWAGRGEEKLRFLPVTIAVAEVREVKELQIEGKKQLHIRFDVRAEKLSPMAQLLNSEAEARWGSLLGKNFEAKAVFYEGMYGYFLPIVRDPRVTADLRLRKVSMPP